MNNSGSRDGPLDVLIDPSPGRRRFRDSLPSVTDLTPLSPTSSSLPDTVDCLVVGGGPAGATAARLLAQRGHSVVLVDRGSAHRGIPSETVVASALPTLARLELIDVLRRLDARGPQRHGSSWGSDEVTYHEATDADRGFLVDRPTLDATLREFAVSRGVTLLDGVAVRDSLPTPGNGTVLLHDDSGCTVSIATRTVVVTVGRSPLGGLLPVTTENELPATTALAAFVSTASTLTTIPSSAADFAAATLVESVREGWLWWIPARGRDGRGTYVTLFADADEVRERGRESVFRSALDASRAPGTFRLHARNIGPTFGAVATARRQSTSTNVILGGDAAAAVDPLSSQGLEKALASGERVAVAVNTLLDDANLTPLVCARHRSWERRMDVAHAGRTLDWYARESRFATAPFWARRIAAREELRARMSSLASRPLPSRLRVDDAVERCPALERHGDHYELADGLGLPEDDDPLVKLGSVPVIALAELVRRCGDVDAVVAACAHDVAFASLSPRLVVQALTELWARGIIADDTE